MFQIIFGEIVRNAAREPLWAPELKQSSGDQDIPDHPHLCFRCCRSAWFDFGQSQVCSILFAPSRLNLCLGPPQRHCAPWPTRRLNDVDHNKRNIILLARGSRLAATDLSEKLI